MNLDKYEWQLTGDDEWVFGEKVRGMVRQAVAEIYFDEDLDGSPGGWIWFTREHGRGRAVSRPQAVYAVEAALGLGQPSPPPGVPIRMTEEQQQRAVELIRWLARPANWFPDGTEDNVYLGTQLRGMDSDVTPTVGQCRAALTFLEEVLS